VININNERFEYIWQVGRNDLFDGMTHADHVSTGLGVWSTGLSETACSKVCNAVQSQPAVSGRASMYMHMYTYSSKDTNDRKSNCPAG
jgi:hypothetical protein